MSVKRLLNILIDKKFQVVQKLKYKNIQVGISKFAHSKSFRRTQKKKPS
jgi:hypothetical protein